MFEWLFLHITEYRLALKSMGVQFISGDTERTASEQGRVKPATGGCIKQR